jgi:tRNA threonylcarbamoyladenosine biosynthesis protein TsaE
MSGAPETASAVVLAVRTSGPDDTRALGAALSGVLRPGDVVLLTGDLGAGKTVLAQGIAAGLGVADSVTSPTFTLVRPLPCGPGPIKTMHHADLYRLEHRREVVDLALGELVEDESVAVVEWGEAAAHVLGADTLAIRLLAPDLVADDTARVITCTPGGTWLARVDELSGALGPWVRADTAPAGVEG